MPRNRPETRTDDLLQAGTKVFLECGYRRAQISDIAKAMGVASGTVYLYVESKEALFDAVIRAGVSPQTAEQWEFPLKTPPRAATLSFIERALAKESRITSLEAALQARRAPKETAVELETILREIYAKTSRHWLALKLVERSALDWPELAALWFGKHRLRVLQQLTRYFERRTGSGALREPPGVPAAARLVLEMIAAFAMHCRTDSAVILMDQAVAEATVIDAIVHAYVPPETPSPKIATQRRRTSWNCGITTFC